MTIPQTNYSFYFCLAVAARATEHVYRNMYNLHVV